MVWDWWNKLLSLRLVYDILAWVSHLECQCYGCVYAHASVVWPWSTVSCGPGYSVVWPWSTVSCGPGLQCCVALVYSVMWPWSTVSCGPGLQCRVALVYSVVWPWSTVSCDPLCMFVLHIHKARELALNEGLLKDPQQLRKKWKMSKVRIACAPGLQAVTHTWYTRTYKCAHVRTYARTVCVVLWVTFTCMCVHLVH